MPHARRHVGDDVGVELVLLDSVLQVVLVPGAVGPLQPDEPVERPLGLGPLAADGQRHGRLDVVPRVGVTAREPRDHPVRPLPRGDRIHGLGDVVASDDSLHVHQTTSGLRA